MTKPETEHEAWHDREVEGYTKAVEELLPKLEAVAHFTSGALTSIDKKRIFRKTLHKHKMFGMFKAFIEHWKYQGGL